jgi:hypothetical protein
MDWMNQMASISVMYLWAFTAWMLNLSVGEARIPQELVHLRTLKPEAGHWVSISCMEVL